MKNPKWQRDELILALDLYFRLKPGEIHGRNPKIIELSEMLNQLPIHDAVDKNTKFRNPNGVGLKLSNFLSIDPDYHGKGMERVSKLDRAVFYEFKDQKEQLTSIAKSIKSVILSPTVNTLSYLPPEEDSEVVSQVREGKILYRLHRTRERDQKIVKRKKAKVLAATGTLACEVCNFDFFATYGELGSGFIECHHKQPLAELGTEQSTTLQDLALVCANCHRMLHRGISTLSVGALKTMVKHDH